MGNISPVSIIIPTLNEEGYLPLLLESLKKISSPLDITVVDGNSTDKTCEVAERFQQFFIGVSSLRLIRSEKRSISLQRNMGAEHAKHDILIFSDADIILPSYEAHEKMITEFLKNKYVAGAPIMAPIESQWDIRLAYKLMTWTQKILLMLDRPYFAGSYLLTTKDTFFRIGGFDPNVLLGEDIDYSLRAAKLGACGLLKTSILVSARRLVKYGYMWIFKDITNLFRLLFTGRVRAEKIFYPFGDFGNPPVKK
ncbi:MAG: glycosyltransferase [bacterium]|nr:glycosyltransferase [bacterium]